LDCGIDWQNRVLILDQVAKGEDAFPGAQSFVVESAVNVQFMVKDSKKYAATGEGKQVLCKASSPGFPSLKSPNPQPAKAHDFVFAHYAATP
jgi:hypothetical protein